MTQRAERLDMLCTCQAKGKRKHATLVLNAKRRRNPLRVDPTRTLSIRRRFITDIRKRFRKLKAAIRDFVDTKDALALKDSSTRMFHINARFREFEFRSDEGKLEAFRDWLQQQVEADIFSVPRGSNPNAPWTSEYIESAYKRGLINSYLASKQAGLFDGTDAEDLSKEEFLRSAFNQPEALSKVRLLATRAFEDLKGVTSQMAANMNSILAQGMIDGLGASEIATQMLARVDGLTASRALMIARTEIIHAHSEGQLDAYEKLGVDELGVDVEWSTAGDDRVCPRCAKLEGKVFKLEEARGLIPLHPQCRCAWLPAAVDLTDIK